LNFLNYFITTSFIFWLKLKKGVKGKNEEYFKEKLERVFIAKFLLLYKKYRKLKINEKIYKLRYFIIKVQIYDKI